MKKIRLDLDTLDVRSFATEEVPSDARGTVHARRITWDTGGHYTLDTQNSCCMACTTAEYYTCWETQPSVGPSCGGLCTAPSINCYPPDWTEACA